MPENKMELQPGTRRFYWVLFKSTFLISAFTVGGGMVIIPLLKSKFVDEYGWIDDKETLDIVAIAQKKNIKVVPLVGPNSMIMAVMGSGFSGQSFAFNGYLPVKPGDRANKLKMLESRAYKEDQTQLFIETPYRNAQLFDTVIKCCRPETKLCVAAGITTDQEFIKTKTVAQWKKDGLPEMKKVPAIFAIYK